MADVLYVTLVKHARFTRQIALRPVDGEVLPGCRDTNAREYLLWTLVLLASLRFSENTPQQRMRIFM